MNNIGLLKAETVKKIGDIKAYWLNYIFGNINVFFLFLGIFYAFSKSIQTDGDVFNLLMGLMLWYYGVHAIDLIAIMVEEEAEQGTLEQIFMTSTCFVKVLFYRIISQLIFDTIKGVFVFVLCIFAFKIPFHFIASIKWIPTLFIFFLTLVGLYGVGYMVAGLSMIYKKVTSIAGVCSNLLLYFSGIIISIDKIPTLFQCFSKILPLYWGAETLKALVENQFDFFYVATIECFHYLIVSVSLCIFIGICFFKWCQKRAIRNGTLAQY